MASQFGIFDLTKMTLEAQRLREEAEAIKAAMVQPTFSTSDVVKPHSNGESESGDVHNRFASTVRVLAKFGGFRRPGIDKLPDKLLLHIMSYLDHKQILRTARVCRKWRAIAYDSRLWQVVSLRPEYNGLQIASIDHLIALISIRFGPSLRWMELPMELIQAQVLHELANKCPKLRYLTLDFANAMQLHDFNDLVCFPARLKSLTICLSEVIFLEGFLKKIYTFISSLEVLHLIGTYEKIEDEEEEVFEVINLHKLKVHIPHLRILNLFGISFVTDDHIDGISQTCAHLECLSINFCQKFTGAGLKPLFSRCKRLKSLLMEQCLLKNKEVQHADWDAVQLQELNITGTELSSECLVSVLRRLPNLRWLSAGYLEGFNGRVMEGWLESGSCKNITAVDLNTSDSLTEASVTEFVSRYGHQLTGLNLKGLPFLTEHFWTTQIPKMHKIRILAMGMAEDCCSKMTSRMHIDSIVNKISENCTQIQKLEIGWDMDTLRFSDKSTKFIDMIRVRCTKLQSLTICDGKYYELVRSNYERAGRTTVVRTTTNYRTDLVKLLTYYHELIFN